MIPDLSGKSIAIVAMGKSHSQFILAKTHSQPIDEVWAINAMAGVIYHDRVFMMDPASRFLDSDDAGTQTGLMRSVLDKHTRTSGAASKGCAWRNTPTTSTDAGEEPARRRPGGKS